MPVSYTHLDVYKRQIIHFASRGAMNIEGLGIANVTALVEQGLIQSTADLDVYKRQAL